VLNVSSELTDSLLSDNNSSLSDNISSFSCSEFFEMVLEVELDERLTVGPPPFP